MTANKENQSLRKKERQKIKKLKLTIKNCQWCGVHESAKVMVSPGSYYTGLSAHHLKLFCEGGRLEDGIAFLCERCHRDIHTVNGDFNRSHVNLEMTKILIDKILNTKTT